MGLRLIQLTPPGRGAIASFRVEGAKALEVVARHFLPRGGRPLTKFSLGRVIVGRFAGPALGATEAAGTAAPQPGEEVVLNRCSESAVEFHCHGGLAVVARVEEILTAEGCRPVSWQDWIRGQEADPIAAAARLALAEARTARTAAVLLDQYHGALRRALDEIEAALAAGAKDAARQQIRALLECAPVGLHLVHHWQVVIAGRPNVGKSSLINALAGYQRAIVHSSPGTTRDVVSVETAMDGWPVEISDTAGLRQTGEKVERIGLELARRKIAEADLVVLVFDRSLPWCEEDNALMEAYPAALRLYNKSDLPPAPGERPAGMEVSAMRSVGIDDLCHEIAQRLVPRPLSPGAAVPFEPGQIDALESQL